MEKTQDLFFPQEPTRAAGCGCLVTASVSPRYMWTDRPIVTKVLFLNEIFLADITLI